MKREDVVLRLSTKGRDELLKTLRDMGGEYEKTASRVARASQKPTAGMKALNASSQEVQGSFRGLANQGGPLSSVLGSIGPAGLAAAAGIGALAAGLGAALRIGREAVTAFSDLASQASVLQITAETFQALEFGANSAGVAVTQVDTAVRALTERSAQLASGQGELVSRLKDTNPELLEQLKLARSNDDRLRLLSKALRGATDATDANRIAIAAFGEAGIGMVRVLGDVEGGLDGLITQASTAGAIIGDDLIAEAARMNSEFALAEQRIDNELKSAFLGLAPVVLKSRQAFADAATALGDLVQGFEKLEDRAAGTLNRELEKNIKALERLGFERAELAKAIESGDELNLEAFNVEFTGTIFQSAAAQANAAKFVIGELNEALGELNGRKAERQRANALAEQLRQPLDALIAERDALLEAREILKGTVRSAGRSGDTAGVNAAQSEAVDISATIRAIEEEIAIRERAKGALAEEQRLRDEAAAKRRAEAAASRKASKDLAEKNQLRAQAKRIILELAGAEGQLLAETERLNTLLEADFLTQDQYDAKLKEVTATLTGAAKASERWAQMVSAARSPVEKAGAAILDLENDFAEGLVGIDAYNETLVVLKANLAEVTQRAVESTQAFKDQQALEQQQDREAQSVRDGIEQARVDGLSPTQRLAEEQARLDKLVQAGKLSIQDAAASLDIYSKSLNDAAKASSGLGVAEGLLNGIQAGRIETIGDLGAALGQLLLDYVQQQLFAQQQLGASGGGLGGLFSGIFGGGGAGQGGGGGLLGSLGGLFGGLFHDGGPANQRPRRFRNLSRGIDADENLSITRMDERVLRPQDQIDFRQSISMLAQATSALSAVPGAPAAGAGQGGGFNFRQEVIIPPNTRAEETQSRDGQGNITSRLTIREIMRTEIGSGQMDGALSSRPGANRRGVS